MIYIYSTKYTITSAIDTLNQAHTHTHAHTHARTHVYTHNDTHTHTNQNVGKRWDLSVVLKDENEWENLIFFGSVSKVLEQRKRKSVHCRTSY